MKILNLNKLDASVGKRRELVIDDQSYPIVEMTVDNFIATSQEASRLERDNGTVTEMIEATVALILRSVPTLSREALGGRSLEVLNTIAAFVRGDEIDAAEEQDADAAGK